MFLCAAASKRLVAGDTGFQADSAPHTTFLVAIEKDEPSRFRLKSLEQTANKGEEDYGGPQTGGGKVFDGYAFIGKNSTITKLRFSGDYETRLVLIDTGANSLGAWVRRGGKKWGGVGTEGDYIC